MRFSFYNPTVYRDGHNLQWNLIPMLEALGFDDISAHYYGISAEIPPGWTATSNDGKHLLMDSSGFCRFMSQKDPESKQWNTTLVGHLEKALFNIGVPQLWMGTADEAKLNVSGICDTLWIQTIPNGAIGTVEVILLGTARIDDKRQQITGTIYIPRGNVKPTPLSDVKIVELSIAELYVLAVKKGWIKQS